MANRKKQLFWVLVVALPVVAVFALAVASRIVYPWPELPPGANLTPLYPAIPKSELKPDNAVYYLAQLPDFKITTPTNSQSTPFAEADRFASCGWEPGQYPLMEAAQKDFTPTLELLRQAAAAPEARMTIVESFWAVISISPRCRAAAKYLCFLADRAAGLGEWENASAFGRLGLSFDRPLSRGGLLIDRLMSFACDSVSLQMFRRVASERTPPPAWLREQLVLLAKTDAATVPFEDTLRNDFLLPVQDVAIQELFSQIADTPKDGAGSLNGYGVDGIEDQIRVVRWFNKAGLLPLFGSTPQKTARHLRNVNATILAGWHTLPQPSNSIPQSTATRLSWLEWLNDPVGKILNNKVLLSYENVCRGKNRFLRHLAISRGTALVLALRLHQLEHGGKLPAPLAELVTANCLEKLPDDPFAPPGTTFGYRVNPDGSFVVWSRGDNLQDDGGKYEATKPGPAQTGTVDIIFSSTEFQDCRANWRKEHPEKSAGGLH